MLPGLAGCQSSGDGGTILSDLVEPWTPPTPSEAARDAFNVYDADKRRRSVSLLAAAPFGGEEPYVRTYRLLMDDPDATVRAACIKALGMHGSVDDALLVIPGLRDEVSFVRWEAAQALQRIHHPGAVGPLMEVMKNDEDADVRMAAADALGQYARPAVFDALVGMLTDANYGVARSAASSLRTLTGQSFGEDPGEWLSWSRDRRAELFVGQRQYVYQPYDKPPGLLKSMRFWAEDESPQPQVPIGVETSGRDGEVSS